MLSVSTVANFFMLNLASPDFLNGNESSNLIPVEEKDVRKLVQGGGLQYLLETIVTTPMEPTACV